MQFLLALRRFFFPVLLLLLVFPQLSEASKVIFTRTIVWQEVLNRQVDGTNFPHYVTFYEAHHKKKLNQMPIWSETIRLYSKAKNVKIQLTNIKLGTWQHKLPTAYETVLKQNTDFNLEYNTAIEQGNTCVLFSFAPLQYSGNVNKVLPIVSFDVEITYDIDFVNNSQSLSKKAFATKSVLAQGLWYKMAITQTGFYKLDRQFFISNGINIDLINPKTIKIYGNGAGLVPQQNSLQRHDDLVENSILVEGESDGVFNNTDYVLFYAKSQFDVWEQKGAYLERQKNVYADTTYVFLTFNQGLGKRIDKQTIQPIPNSIESTQQYCFAHELDLINVGKTGRRFLGEAFDKMPVQSKTISIDGFIASEPIRLRSAAAARSNILPATFTVLVNGNQLLQHQLETVGTGYEDAYYAYHGPVTTTYQSNTPQQTITYTYSSPPGGAIGWLDFFELNTKTQLKWSNSQVLFRLLPTSTPGNTAYNISNTPNGARLFNASNQTTLQELIVTINSGVGNVVANTAAYTELVGFSPVSSFLQPIMVGQIANQNLHGLEQVEGLYITPGIFYNEALRLAYYHKQNGVNIHVINVNDIYNEFSSGAQDISAIRDFIRMFYKRATTPNEKLKYVTFFGRSSYDYKYRISANSNFIPSFQSPVSETPLTSYCSDDFFAFLDDNEGTWETGSEVKELLDIGIGRLPISNQTEAAFAVDKIISYHQKDKLKDWRNKIVFVADDEDNNIHQNDANDMADDVRTKFKSYNVQKILIDAYKKEVVAGGQRYPAAQKAINDAVQKGCFIVNYTGHGGELGWAAERILTIEDINSWQNANRLPLFVTATCEFSRFDDPARISAGELAFLNKNGGAIALFTTARLVSAYSNTQLNKAFYKHVGLDSTSKITALALGEIMRLTKNDYINIKSDKNERNFTLLGDAVFSLAYPKHVVHTTSINGNSINNITDTLKALSKVTITGDVKNISGQLLNTFNGTVYPTVYDKPGNYQTLGNSGGTINFSMQNNVIYSGQASVVNGIFTFSFIVPKDISYQLGNGKISYYAEDQAIDANGYNEGFLIGGTSDSIGIDNQGPEIRLFMEDDKFVFGGVTDETPLFIAKLFDENGINTLGSGIGRELMLTIDNNTAKAVAVNEYYKGKKDSYQEGEVSYLISKLEPGIHTAKLKAWDTYNNSSEAITEFVVANNETMAIKHLLNYPNPFTTNTTFHFDHNKAGQNLQIIVQIFTISGKLAKTLSTEVTPSNSHFDELKWNGLDDFGDKLAKGVYLYKLKVKSSDGKFAEAAQKLVILN